LGEGIFGFLTTRDACALRLVCRLCCADVAAARWHDEETRISGSLAAWRKCFPDARVANMVWRSDLRDADFARLAGLKALDMNGCTGITDAGLAHLVGIHTLEMFNCALITDAGLAHLTGIHTLEMFNCALITDAGLAHLTGIHTLNMYGCEQITDAGLAHLTGIHTLNMSGCALITDAGLAHLTGGQLMSENGETCPCPKRRFVSTPAFEAPTCFPIISNFATNIIMILGTSAFFLATETRSRGRNGHRLFVAGPRWPRQPWGGFFHLAEAEIYRFLAAPEAH
jgi:hypothetical protein